MALILEGVLQSSLIVSILSGIFLLFFRRKHTVWHPRLILWIWRILCLRLLIIVPIIYFSSMITSAAELLNAAPPDFVRDFKLVQNTLVYILSPSYTVQPFFFIWLLGMIVFLTAHFVRYFHTAKLLLNNSSRISDLYKYTFEYGFKVKKSWKRIDVISCPALSGPMIVGFWKKYMFIPEGDFSKDDIRMMLSHELMHLKNHDMLLQHLFLIANAIHWFNPVIYLIQKRIKEDIELLCDYNIVRNMTQDERIGYIELLYYTLTKSDKKLSLFLSLSENAKILKHRFLSIEAADKKRHFLLPALVMAAALFILQPFTYIDAFATPFEQSYIAIQHVLPGNYAYIEHIPFADMYYKDNNEKYKRVGDSDTINLSPSETIEFFYSEDKLPLSLNQDEIIKIELKTMGNQHFIIDIGGIQKDAYQLYRGDFVCFTYPGEGPLSITNISTDNSIFY